MNNRLEQEAADGKGGTMNREATGTAEIQKRVSREWNMRVSCLLMPSFLSLIAIIGGRCKPSQKRWLKFSKHTGQPSLNIRSHTEMI
jgi:hypothetical protein